MILYRQVIDESFEFTFKIKVIATKKPVEEIWSWDNDLQLDFHKNQFNPNKTKIIIYGTQEVVYLSTSMIGNILLTENILIDIDFQGIKIGTRVVFDTIETAFEYNEIIELQVLKINTGAIKLYECLNFQTFEETELHYKMRYQR